MFNRKTFSGTSLYTVIIISVTFFSCNKILPKIDSTLTKNQEIIVGTNLNIDASVADNMGLKKVNLYIDDNLITSLKNEPFLFEFPVKNIPVGSHVFKIKAVNKFFLSKSIKIPVEIIRHKMIFVEGGKFSMGRKNGNSDEAPIHEVSLSSFFISSTEITNLNYCDFLNETGVDKYGSKNDQKLIYLLDFDNQISYDNDQFIPIPGKENYPVMNITWHGASTYATWAGGRLPYEAEWEFAAKGGNLSNNYLFSGSNDPNEVGWCWSNSENILNALIENHGTFEVGKKNPNELGVFDMSGNVWEWCNDWYASDYYGNSENNNPLGPENGYEKVLRGGSWFFNCGGINVFNRLHRRPELAYNYIGFRIVKEN